MMSIDASTSDKAAAVPLAGGVPYLPVDPSHRVRLVSSEYYNEGTTSTSTSSYQHTMQPHLVLGDLLPQCRSPPPPPPRASDEPGCRNAILEKQEEDRDEARPTAESEASCTRTPEVALDEDLPNFTDSLQAKTREQDEEKVCSSKPEQHISISIATPGGSRTTSRGDDDTATTTGGTPPLDVDVISCTELDRSGYRKWTPPEKMINHDDDSALQHRARSNGNIIHGLHDPLARTSITSTATRREYDLAGRGGRETVVPVAEHNEVVLLTPRKVEFAVRLNGVVLEETAPSRLSGASETPETGHLSQLEESQQKLHQRQSSATTTARRFITGGYVKQVGLEETNARTFSTTHLSHLACSSVDAEWRQSSYLAQYTPTPAPTSVVGHALPPQQGSSSPELKLSSRSLPSRISGGTLEMAREIYVPNARISLFSATLSPQRGTGEDTSRVKTNHIIREQHEDAHASSTSSRPASSLNTPSRSLGYNARGASSSSNYFIEEDQASSFLRSKGFPAEEPKVVVSESRLEEQDQAKNPRGQGGPAMHNATSISCRSTGLSLKNCTKPATSDVQSSHHHQDEYIDNLPAACSSSALTLVRDEEREHHGEQQHFHLPAMNQSRSIQHVPWLRDTGGAQHVPWLRDTSCGERTSFDVSSFGACSQRFSPWSRDISGASSTGSGGSSTNTRGPHYNDNNYVSNRLLANGWEFFQISSEHDLASFANPRCSSWEAQNRASASPAVTSESDVDLVFSDDYVLKKRWHDRMEASDNGIAAVELRILQSTTTVNYEGDQLTSSTSSSFVAQIYPRFTLSRTALLVLKRENKEQVEGSLENQHVEWHYLLQLEPAEVRILREEDEKVVGRKIASLLVHFFANRQHQSATVMGG
ncbi:unnamed protein product [Amoebophrya sp. A25]|nr:unnamed protein product [Amoebophrya sp. A25]|eukprot:GSA25T00021960001.1